MATSRRRALATLIVATLILSMTGTALAAKPDHAKGNGKGKDKQTTTTTVAPTTSTTIAPTTTSTSTTTPSTTSTTSTTTTTVAPPPSDGWAPAATASIHPGVQTVTNGAQCTSNFVFTSGGDVFIGQAAHCSGNAGSTSTGGCNQNATDPIGTSVNIDGASRPGTLVYSSWNTMTARGETNGNACSYNDFALIKVHPDDVGRVNPSLPAWGGPHGQGTTTTSRSVYTFGNSGLRFGIRSLSPKTGTTLSAGGGEWTYSIYTNTPGVPGDSGSAVLNDDGAALGVLVTVAIAPFAGSNGVTDITKALNYARQHGSALAPHGVDLRNVQLANGTETFNGSLLGLAR